MILRGTFVAFTMKSELEKAFAFAIFTSKAGLGAVWMMGGIFSNLFTMKRLVGLACRKSVSRLFAKVFAI